MSEQEEHRFNHLLAVLQPVVGWLSVPQVQALRVLVEESGILSACGDARKPNGTTAKRNDQPWGCVLGLPKRAQGNVAQIAGAACSAKP